MPVQRPGPRLPQVRLPRAQLAQGQQSQASPPVPLQVQAQAPLRAQLVPSQVLAQVPLGVLLVPLRVLLVLPQVQALVPLLAQPGLPARAWVLALLPALPGLLLREPLQVRFPVSLPGSLPSTYRSRALAMRRRLGKW